MRSVGPLRSLRSTDQHWVTSDRLGWDVHLAGAEGFPARARRLHFGRSCEGRITPSGCFGRGDVHLQSLESPKPSKSVLRRACWYLPIVSHEQGITVHHPGLPQVLLWEQAGRGGIRHPPHAALKAIATRSGQWLGDVSWRLHAPRDTPSPQAERKWGVSS
jgi:hypothetical protein